MLKPLNKAIFLEYEEQGEEKTKSGLILGGEQQDKIIQGKVISVGGEVKEIKPGDIVYYTKRNSEVKEIAGKKYVMLFETPADIIAVEN